VFEVDASEFQVDSFPAVGRLVDEFDELIELR